MIKFFINTIKTAIGFSKTEARGTLALIFIMITALTLSQIYIKKLKSQNEIINDDDLEGWVATVKASIKLKPKDNIDKQSVYFSSKKTKKNPVSKSRPPKVKEPAKVSEEKPIILKDLNLATAEELQRVKGIGPSYSKRIIKYRNLLGGFANTDQLNEVYGLSEETIFELLKHFSLQSQVQSININTDSAKVLAKHPYISYDLAWVIINYRKQNGDIDSLDDLKKIKAIDDATFTRLTPYLD